MANGFPDDFGANACALNLNPEKNANFSVRFANTCTPRCPKVIRTK
jgi:hypothetical protein